MSIFDNYYITYLVLNNLSLSDIFRLETINKTFYSAIKDLIKKKWIIEIYQPACQCMVILKSEFIMNIIDYKKYMKQVKWDAITKLFNKYYYVFLTDKNICNCFINLILDKNSYLHNIFYTEKWYLSRELERMRKVICIQNPNKYKLSELKDLSFFSNIKEIQLLIK